MKIVRILIFSLIGIFALSNLIYFPGFKVWAFSELKLIDSEKVTSLTINRREEKVEVEITDKKEIQKVLNDFSKMELRKIKRESDANDSDTKAAKENNYTYNIYVYENNQDVGTIYLSGTSYMVFYSKFSDEIPIYKIENNPDLEIHEVFNSAKNK
ncbi:hypothetical protein B5G50_28335 [Brevibacillus brevis]|uniref:hypothetical protein n=1 Tax=Brevibacillus brevis TaxID=1393 RepID=UPI000B37E621|nr:hypothetical protein [Brevibacillus brevis]OUQ85207.1 hypothetical protein B5G50_28335 [Brevibacillus brevis]